NISLGLNPDGITKECAGVVQFTTPSRVINVCNQNWTKFLLTTPCFSDRVKIELRDDQKSQCYGEIYVNVNGSHNAVCSTDIISYWKTAEVVCRELQCGTPLSAEQGSKIKGGKISLLECKGQEKSLWECMRKHGNVGICQTIKIVCSEHELWFLQGNTTCEGKVMGETSGYLQNISNERADEVCKINLCKGVQNTSKSDISNSNMKSTVCPENATSSFNCSMENSTTSAPAKPQDAYVKCSGSLEVRLQNKCHGKVLVCPTDNCGVCEDTWTDKQSEMLCKTLGCGQAIKETYRGNKTPAVTVASVHCSQKAENFRQCNFVPLKDPSLCKNPAYVSCTGSVTALLQDPRDKCAGIPSLFYSGKLFPLCTQGINKETQNGFCAIFGCGEALSFKNSLSTDGQGLAGITCKDKDISNCDFSKTEIQECKIGHLKCTDWRRLVLINVENACKGEVYLQTEFNKTAVSSDNWNNKERIELCKHLECGNVSTVSNPTSSNQIMPFWSRAFSCPSKPNSIWDCESEKVPVNIQQQLHINCTNEPDMTLSGTCTGEVLVNEEHVCFQSENTDAVLNEFCFMQKCSALFKTWSTKNNTKNTARFLRCTGNESKMWQCNSGTSHCKDVISLACTNAIQINFSSPCGGDLLVNYRGQLEHVCPLNHKADADRICSYKECGNARQTSKNNLENNLTTNISISCIDNPNDIRRCFTSGNLSCTEKAQIYCDILIGIGIDSQPMPQNPATGCSAGPQPGKMGGLSLYMIAIPDYVSPKETNTGLIVGIVVGLVLLLVAVLIMYRKRKAIRAILRLKFPEEDSDMDVSENEMQNLNAKDVFETDDYDDVVASVNSMEENQSDGASEYDEEDASTSQGSSGTEYDDVDEGNVKKSADNSPAEPILPPRSNNLLDKVTFEVEVEPQEDYDDVISPQTVDSEQKESLDIPDPSTDPPLTVFNDEAMSQKDQ
ncbi:hypothetical protein QTP70_030115, partial [Hemibagrus guttatus]